MVAWSRSSGAASHAAQNNTLVVQSIFNTEYGFSYCAVCSLHTLCSLPDNQTPKHNRARLHSTIAQGSGVGLHGPVVQGPGAGP